MGERTKGEAQRAEHGRPEGEDVVGSTVHEVRGGAFARSGVWCTKWARRGI